MTFESKDILPKIVIAAAASWIASFLLLFIFSAANGLQISDVFRNSAMLPGVASILLSLYTGYNAAHLKSVSFYALSLFVYMATVVGYINLLGEDRFRSPITGNVYLDNSVFLGGIYLGLSIIFFVIILFSNNHSK